MLAFYLQIGFKPVIHFMTGFKTSFFCSIIICIYYNHFPKFVQINATALPDQRQV
jgi:hypothetical protein